MCRYVAYLGPPVSLDDLFYRPSNSLIHQAVEAIESPTRINADGFGVGWYIPGANPEPALFKDLTPAWNNANLRSLADKISSRCVLAHVRAARGNDPVSRANCHPFERFRLLWMHNGDIPGRGRLHRRVVAAADDELVARIQGSTDSELAFTLFLSQLETPLDREFEVDELAEALRGTVARIVGWYEQDGDERELALNFCVSDGKSILATRFGRNVGEPPSLHTCSVVPFGHETGEGCALLSSEVLFDDPRWDVVPVDCLVIVRESLEIEQQPLGG